jgi:hypothetical protein
VGELIDLNFTGFNIEDGDSAMWVREGVGRCRLDLATTPLVPISSMGGSSGTATFRFFEAGIHVLCYLFSHTRGLPYLQFPNIRVAVISVSSIAPYATAVGCQSTVDVNGAGFRLFGGAPAFTLACTWGALGETTVTVSKDTHFSCRSPAPGMAGEMLMALAVRPAAGNAEAEPDESGTST